MPFHHSIHWLYIFLTAVLKAPIKTTLCIHIKNGVCFKLDSR
uniref:Uncharacterized protein n=1 Tax=Arundo donax TaxID=35708 RepID=A0A0A9AI46_ARUDO